MPCSAFFPILQAWSCSKIKMAAVCGLIMACIVIGILIVSFIITGVANLGKLPQCEALYFGTKEPNIVTLPDLHNLSSSERNSLLKGTYKLSHEYNLKLLIEDRQLIELCVTKRDYTPVSAPVSACVDVGTDLENLWICSPDMRPDCLPSAIVDRFFGLSLWYQEESTVMYTIVNTDTGMISGKNVTNTTSTLSAVWYDGLGCQVFLKLTIAVIFFGSLTFICCLGCAGCCLWICCFCCKEKW